MHCNRYNKDNWILPQVFSTKYMYTLIDISIIHLHDLVPFGLEANHLCTVLVLEQMSNLNAIYFCFQATCFKGGLVGRELTVWSV